MHGFGRYRCSVIIYLILQQQDHKKNPSLHAILQNVRVTNGAQSAFGFAYLDGGRIGGSGARSGANLPNLFTLLLLPVWKQRRSDRRSDAAPDGPIPPLQLSC